MYRYATGTACGVTGQRTSVGENRTGEPGFAIILDCATGAEGPGMSVEVGWSKNPNATTPWKGGLVSGVIVPDDKSRFRLVAAGAVPGLEPSARAGADGENLPGAQSRSMRRPGSASPQSRSSSTASRCGSG